MPDLPFAEMKSLSACKGTLSLLDVVQTFSSRDLIFTHGFDCMDDPAHSEPKKTKRSTHPRPRQDGIGVSFLSCDACGFQNSLRRCPLTRHWLLCSEECFQSSLEELRVRVRGSEVLGRRAGCLTWSKLVLSRKDSFLTLDPLLNFWSRCLTLILTLGPSAMIFPSWFSRKSITTVFSQRLKQVEVTEVSMSYSWRKAPYRQLHDPHLPAQYIAPARNVRVSVSKRQCGLVFFWGIPFWLVLKGNPKESHSFWGSP